MTRRAKKIRVLLWTNLLVSNREAANAFLSYLAYAIGGLILSGVAIVRVIEPGSKETGIFPMMYLALAVMFDYFSIQSKLAATTLIDNSTLVLFPMSRLRSIITRFVLIVFDKRALIYLLPMIPVLYILGEKGGMGQVPVMFLLFAAAYLIASEIILPVFLFLRKLAERFSAKTVTQVAAIPFLLVFLLPSVLHFHVDISFHIPVLSEFNNGFQYLISAHTIQASLEVGKLLLIAALIALVMLAADSVYVRLAPAMRPKRDAEPALHRRADIDTPPDSIPSMLESSDKQYDRDVPDASDRAEIGLTLRRYISLDWKIRQKEERVVYSLFMYPFLAAWGANMMFHQAHKPIDSVILLIFFIALMLGIAVTENHLTDRGLRLKHVSIFPVDSIRFVLVKSLSVWFLMSVVNLAAVLLIGIWSRVGAFQLIQGTVYSMYISTVFISCANTLSLFFNSISRHPLISVLIILVVEAIATVVYVLLMIFSFAVGLAAAVTFGLLTYYLWIPSWGTKLSSEFQTLLEESK